MHLKSTFLFWKTLKIWPPPHYQKVHILHCGLFFIILLYYDAMTGRSKSPGHPPSTNLFAVASQVLCVWVYFYAIEWSKVDVPSLWKSFEDELQQIS